SCRYHAEVQLPALQIDADDGDVDLVAETVAAFAAPADQAVRGIVVVVIVIGQRADMDQAFDRQLLGLAEETVVSDPGDDYLQLQPDPFAQVRKQLELDQFAFGNVSAALGLAAMFAKGRQLGGV